MTVLSGARLAGFCGVLRRARTGRERAGLPSVSSPVAGAAGGLGDVASQRPEIGGHAIT